MKMFLIIISMDTEHIVSKIGLYDDRDRGTKELISMDTEQIVYVHAW